jgi:hypothetical protein
MRLIDFVEKFAPVGETKLLKPSPTSIEERELGRNLAPEFHYLSPS